MRHLAMMFVLPLVVSTFACGEDEPEASAPATDAERVFSVGSSSTVNTSAIEGIWETKSARVQSGLESMIRLELRRDRVVAAARCMPTNGDDATVLGTTGKANVSPSTLEFPEEVRASKPIGSSYCGVVVHAGVLPQCDLKKLASERKWCFELAKGTLTVREETAADEYVKIAD